MTYPFKLCLFQIYFLLKKEWVDQESMVSAKLSTRFSTLIEQVVNGDIYLVILHLGKQFMGIFVLGKRLDSLLKFMIICAVSFVAI